MFKIILIAVFIIFTGCVSTNEWLKAKPQDFQTGYKAGCINGTDMASYSYKFKTNNTKIYKSNQTYKSGWDEGYTDCYSDKEFDNMTRQR